MSVVCNRHRILLPGPSDQHTLASVDDLRKYTRKLFKDMQIRWALCSRIKYLLYMDYFRHRLEDHQQHYREGISLCFRKSTFLPLRFLT